MTEHDSTTNTARLIGTANRGFAQHAQEEIRRLIPGVKFRTLVPTETFLAEAPGSWDEISAAIRAQEPIFLRHMQPVQGERALSGTDEDILAAAELASELGRLHAGSSSTVQVRMADGTEVPYGASDVRAACEIAMGEATGAETLVRHADKILSVYVGHQAVYAGSPHRKRICPTGAAAPSAFSAKRTRSPARNSSCSRQSASFICILRISAKRSM